jgi:hypothetical protein
MPSSTSRTVRLWPGKAPEAKGDACEDIPTLTIVNPRGGSANGSAVIVLPGGAYRALAGDLEGGEVADWFVAHGFRAFILGVEGLPGTAGPLDPEPGLGGILSLGLFCSQKQVLF